MNMTPEQLNELAKWCDENSSGIYRKSAIAAAALREYAAHLSRQSEGVSDELALAVLNACRDNIQAQGYSRPMSGPDGDKVHIKAMRAAPPAERVRVPDGWKLVPIVPTPEMDAAGKAALSDNGVDNVDASDALVCYRDMLSAAPESDHYD